MLTACQPPAEQPNWLRRVSGQVGCCWGEWRGLGEVRGNTMEGRSGKRLSTHRTAELAQTSAKGRRGGNSNSSTQMQAVQPVSVFTALLDSTEDEGRSRHRPVEVSPAPKRAQVRTRGGGSREYDVLGPRDGAWDRPAASCPRGARRPSNFAPSPRSWLSSTRPRPPHRLQSASSTQRPPARPHHSHSQTPGIEEIRMTLTSSRAHRCGVGRLRERTDGRG